MFEDRLTKIREEEARRPAQVLVPAAAGEGAGVSDLEREERARVDRKRRALLIGGSISLGVGASLLGVTGWTLAEGERMDTEGANAAADGESAEFERLVDRGNLMNGLAIATGVAGGILVVGGVVMIVAGKRSAAPSASALRQFDVGVGPAGASLGWRTRF